MVPALLRRLFSALILATSLWGTPGIAGGSNPVTIFAAASLKTALDDVAGLFAETGGVAQISYGGSSTLARQIQYGAPAQVFISANSDWMDVLEQEGLIVAASRVDLLTNRLVLIAAADNTTSLSIAPGFDLAGALGSERLAMALVQAVPAGLYGRAALLSLGVWDTVKTKVAQTDNVRAALMLVAVGEAPYGIVYATDAKADPRVRIIGLFSADSHPPILYPAAVVAGPDIGGGQAFLDFLTTPEVRDVFRRHGFGLAGDGT